MSVNKQEIDYDESYKRIIEDHFEDFLFFFMPDLANDVDFSKDFEFLDKELIKLFPESEKAKGTVDKLVQVNLKSGGNDLVLIEVQGQISKEEFSLRMFRYYFKLFDRYNKKITSIAIFTDEYKNYKPGVYKSECYGSEIIYRYNTYKILDQNEKELIDNENPFALVVLAGIYTIQSKGDDKLRYRYKIKLAKLLFKRGYSKVKVISLLLFIDHILKLSDILKNKFISEIDSLMEENEMKKFLVGDLTEDSFNKGVEEGKIQMIEQMYEMGKLSEKEYKEMIEPLKKKLDELDK